MRFQKSRGSTPNDALNFSHGQQRSAIIRQQHRREHLLQLSEHVIIGVNEIYVRRYGQALGEGLGDVQLQLPVPIRAAFIGFLKTIAEPAP